LSVKSGILFKKWEFLNFKSEILQIVIPRKRIEQILEAVHDYPSSGHFGVNKTF